MAAETYLITTQSYRHQAGGAEIPLQHSFLAETDFRGYVRLLSIPTPTETPWGERIKGGLRGIAHWGGRLFVASWNTVHMVDYAGFEVIEAFSHPLMADLHGIFVDEQGIWLASSLIDSLLKFSHQWDLQGVLNLTNTSLYPQNARRALDLSRDYRLHGKLEDGFYDYHVNHILGYGRDHVLATGRGDQDDNGRVILVNRESMKFQVWLDRLYGPHDGLFLDADKFAVTETSSASVAIFRMMRGGKPALERRAFLPQTEARYWTRGLAVRPNGNFLVGRSVWRGEDGPASVVELAADGKFVAEHILHIPDYPECRIFQILPAPHSLTSSINLVTMRERNINDRVAGTFSEPGLAAKRS